jgi:hypothetical protein
MAHCTLTPDGHCITSRSVPAECRVHNRELRSQRRAVVPRVALTSSPSATQPALAKNANAVAVAIICHNYGRFLREAIQSILAQTVSAAEIVVVDDSSTDNSAVIAAEFPQVKYIRGEWQHPLKARVAGMRATTSPLLMFLDADDWIAPDYLAAGIAAFADPVIGVVYSDMQEFGESTRYRSMQQTPLTQNNFAHAGSLVRRAAIELLAPETIERGPYQAEDWLLWRLVDRDGWKFAKSPSLYHYRRHTQGRSYTVPRLRWPDCTPFQNEQITLFIPLSGRSQFWPQLSGWLDRQTLPRERISLILADTSGDTEFHASVRAWVQRCDYPDVRLYQHALPVPRGVADADRRDRQTQQHVQLAVAMIYRRMTREVTSDYVWIVEDDIIPPDDAGALLMSQFGATVASVSGAYRSPYYDGYVAKDASGFLRTLPADPVPITGNGFGCIVMRRECLLAFGIQHASPTGDFDRNISHHLNAAGWRSILHPAVDCEHLGLDRR